MSERKLSEALDVMHQKMLEEALDLAEEGWDYASDYFRDKWECERQFKELRVVLDDWRKA